MPLKNDGVFAEPTYDMKMPAATASLIASA